ncbi:uncharacterized protein PV09_00135 [Verruconis gallopava]|uniref:NADH-ubiquinone oxidoreductase B12 subunit n=1 Tax=Verruconis gallopava TaxID=253628 RepID=A0A0D1Z899_9PEZI|nr:uncharacterized protein PV09_00135 [Verruconis gallopava]KIW09207.1 hypothetical protein PV09_00135 [Verruconis gallopava]
MAPPNYTGFDPQKLVRASGPNSADPWKRYEAWRYTGPFSTRNRFRGSFPGLGIGAGAFAVYLVVEALFFKDDHAHGKEHGESGH